MALTADSGALRNFRDFLQLYNQLTENCFSRCVDNVNSRKMEQNEIDCVDDCAQKFINYNNKLMQNFVTAQTTIVGKRVKEAEAAQRELETQATREPDIIQEIAVVDT